MELQNKSNGPAEKEKQPWYGSKSSCQTGEKDNNDGFMTFQSTEAIIQMQDKKAKEKAAAGGGGHGGHLTVEHPTSYLETLMHLFKGNVGSGLFAMGDAIRNAGIILGPITVLCLGLVCTHCQHLLLTSARKMLKNNDIQEAPDFSETVGLCFATGPKPVQKLAPVMRRLVNVFLCITQLGFCCVYFVFISTNLQQVMDYYGIYLDVHLHMAIILLPILLSALVRNLKFLAPLSTIANILMIIGVIITLYFSTQDLPHISERKYVGSLNTIPLFFGTALFAFEGIGLVLPLQNEMKKPRQFARPAGVLNVGMLLVTSLYVTVGTIAYLKYGEDIKGSVTLNLPEDNILAQTVKIMISLGILLTYALQFYIPIDIMWPSINNSLGPFKFPVFAELTFRCLLVLVTFVLAEAIPYLNLFISLVGAVSSTALALLFPPILELVTKYSLSELNPTIVIKDIFILIVGLVGCLTGTYESIHSIVKAFNSET